MLRDGSGGASRLQHLLERTPQLWLVFGIVSGPAVGSNVTRHAVRVRFSDTDLMGIVHHSSYLTYFEAGRVEYMRRRGVNYAEWVGMSIHLPVAELKIRYRHPARFDQRLIIETWIGEMTTHSVRFDYRLTCEEGETPCELIRGYTLLACVDDTGKLRTIPEPMAVRLSGPETHPRDINHV